LNKLKQIPSRTNQKVLPRIIKPDIKVQVYSNK